jgi:hypothetical protein
VFILVRSAAITCIFQGTMARGAAITCVLQVMMVRGASIPCVFTFVLQVMMARGASITCFLPVMKARGAATTCALPVMIANHLFVPLFSAYLPACLFAYVLAYFFASRVLRMLSCVFCVCSGLPNGRAFDNPRFSHKPSR